MDTPFTDSFNRDFLLRTMMGPNAMRITEELAAALPLAPGMRVLDLGCGMGLSSILLAKKHGLSVFAADLWIAPSENAARFASLGLDKSVIPLSVDATQGMPFAREYFDLLISVDAWHYFGAREGMLGSLLPYVKKGGHVAVAVPGLKRELPGGRAPVELEPYWQPEMNFYTCAWWRALWEKEPGLTVESCREMDCLRAAWADWLASPNPYAQHDVPMMQAEGGRWFNLVQIVGQKR